MELERDPDDKKRYVLAGYGELRRGAWYAPSATITAADGTAWDVKRSGFRQKVTITDGAGGEPATFEAAGSFKRGGTFTVGGASYALRPSSKWKERYALMRGDEELATVESGGWSGTRVAVDVHGDVDALVLLTACWLVRQFAEEAATVAASA